jgi:hypothetical protein
MPQFDAAGIVEGLECKLKPYADFDGMIPEPSDKQVGEFFAGLRKVMAEAREKLGGQVIDPADPDQAAEVLDSLDPGDFTRVTGEMAALHAALCSGTPTKAQILAVPLRRRLLFYNWLQGEVMSPEVAAPGGNGQGRPRRATA